MEFSIVDSAVASKSGRAGGAYATLLGSIPLSVKNAEGQYEGKAVAFDKPGQVLSLRAAAKVIGVGIVSRKQDGKTICWKVSKEDLPTRKAHTKKIKKA